MERLFCASGYSIPEGQDHCDVFGCQACCEHPEYDHYVCMDCGHQKDPGEDVDRAMDIFEEDR